MMNQKGFTLVELIAMMVVIGVLMLITVPNISGIIKKNRESVAIADINKMVATAQSRIETDKTIPKLTNEKQCIVFNLKSLDGNNDINKGVNGGTYDKNQSVVVASKQKIAGSSDTYTIKYYFGLLENKSVGARYTSYYTQYKDGRPKLVDYDDFAKKPEESIPIASPRNGDYYMTVNPRYPSDSRYYVNQYAGKTICDTVIAVYNK